MRILLKNCRPVDPEMEIPERADLLLEDGRISQMKTTDNQGDSSAGSAGIETLDLKGAYLLPGLIDMHAHFREPGYEERETIRTGSEAAAAGGFTTVAVMPNTRPVADNPATIELIKARAAEVPIDITPLGSITKGSAGSELAEIGFLSQAGVRGLTDDGQPVMNSEVMRRAMEYASDFDLPIISHCEDLKLAAEGVMHEGYYSSILGLKPIPAAAEEIMIARDIALAELTGARLHIAHLTTSRGLEMVLQARAKGIKVTAEVTPHHLTLTDKAVLGYDTATKVNPPLRSQQDLEALQQALGQDEIDVIATDHAPHTVEEKMGTFDSAAFGISGLETALAVLHQELILADKLDLKKLVRLMYYNPAEILGLETSGLEAGSRADLTVFDPEKKWQVDTGKFKSLGRHSPYNGWDLTGKVLLTIKDGRIIYDDRGDQAEILY